ncbi:SDR family oxidoreductase [Oscillatoria laete-virens NRMC-F 0139]|nr:SDR family oxidoreductase [Oscillatoria laete-virens]MDL5055622.1 SDR family oxidoreductase [Oscillatoria laete-virens NRMC-F 0139]
MADKPLTGKVSVITGASHGLGQAVAAHLAGLGSDLVLIARTADRLNQTADMLRGYGTRVLALPCDIASIEQVQSAANQISREMSRADILINNAGIPAPRTFEETTFADWDQVIGVNLSGAFYLTRALWDLLAASGAGYVITISGSAGVRGGGSPAYGSAKFGLSGLNYAIAAAGKTKKRPRHHPVSRQHGYRLARRADRRKTGVRNDEPGRSGTFYRSACGQPGGICGE